MWKVHDNMALWESAVAMARLDLRHVEKGLFGLEWMGQTIPGVHLNQVKQLEANATAAAWRQLDSLARKDVLVQLYQDAVDDSTTYQIEWRIAHPVTDVIWIDFQFSCNTQQLQYRPHIRCESILPALHRKRLPADLMPVGAAIKNAPAASVDAWIWDVSLFHLEPMPLVCAQIMDTSDVSEESLVLEDAAIRRFVDVFSMPLEKGVVRSIVVRTILTPHAHATENVLRGWQNLTDSYPLPQF